MGEWGRWFCQAWTELALCSVSQRQKCERCQPWQWLLTVLCLSHHRPGPASLLHLQEAHLPCPSQAWCCETRGTVHFSVQLLSLNRDSTRGSLTEQGIPDTSVRSDAAYHSLGDFSEPVFNPLLVTALEDRPRWMQHASSYCSVCLGAQARNSGRALFSPQPPSRQKLLTLFPQDKCTHLLPVPPPTASSH